MRSQNAMSRNQPTPTHGASSSGPVPTRTPALGPQQPPHDPVAGARAARSRGRSGRRRRQRHWIGAGVLSAALLLTGCGDESPAVTARFDAFGDVVDLSVVQVRPDEAEQALETIRTQFQDLELALMPWNDGQMARINRLLPTGETFSAPVLVLPLVHLSQRYADLSENLFNPAIGKLTALWGFNTDVPEGMRPPPEHAIQRLLDANPQMSDIEVDILKLTGRNTSLRLDFSSMVQAYAIDLAIADLRARDIRNAQIKTGANLRAIGERSGQPWRATIPRASGSGVFATLSLEADESVVTRSVHDRNWLHQGTLYHGILDPRTGRPVTHTQSVTVLHPEATVAAAAAVALFVAGPDQWQDVARTLGIEYVMLADRDGTVRMSPELHERLTMIDRHAPIELSSPLSEPETQAMNPSNKP